MKRKEWDFWWVLLVCITWDFLKTPGCFFWLGPITSTLKIVMDLSVVFRVKFQNCPISVLDLVDFLMYQ